MLVSSKPDRSKSKIVSAFGAVISAVFSNEARRSWFRHRRIYAMLRVNWNAVRVKDLKLGSAVDLLYN